MRIGTNTTVFILFFGLALLEAFSSRNWPIAALWLVIGVAFLGADNIKRRRRTKL